MKRRYRITIVPKEQWRESVIENWVYNHWGVNTSKVFLFNPCDKQVYYPCADVGAIVLTNPRP